MTQQGPHRLTKSDARDAGVASLAAHGQIPNRLAK